MTATEFDQKILTANEVLERIKANPNPRHWRSRLKAAWVASVAWGKNLDRTAAQDSARNVLSVIGGATVLADFGTMRAWLALPCMGVALLVWYLDYLRHF